MKMLTISKFNRKVDVISLKDMKVYGSLSDLASGEDKGISISDKRYSETTLYHPYRFYSEK